MKKIMVFMAVAVLATVSASAKGRSFGVTAGLNISRISIEGPSIEFDSKMGILVGGVIDHDLSNSFSIISELAFSQKGWKQGDHAATFNYLQLSPANVTYKIPLPADSKMFVFLGPYFSYLISGSGDYEESNSVLPVDCGINLGAGYQFGKIYGKFQYSMGMVNIASQENKFNKLENSSNVGISVGYFF
ncbi:hypothetical protein AGMMS49982_24340 [Bacteroidia bacterium]|nr:hypothetical protein AGMMS49982_24340 [Bacteroidia bacterium]